MSDVTTEKPFVIAAPALQKRPRSRALKYLLRFVFAVLVLVIVLAAVLVCGMTTIPKQPFWKEALLSPLAETAAMTVKPFLPGGFAQHIQF